MRYFEKQSLMIPMFEAVPETLVKLRRDLTPIVLRGFKKHGPKYFDTYRGRSLNYIRTASKPFENPEAMREQFYKQVKKIPGELKESFNKFKDMMND